jgi:hypothetical protein
MCAETWGVGGLSGSRAFFCGIYFSVVWAAYLAYWCLAIYYVSALNDERQCPNVGIIWSDYNQILDFLKRMQGLNKCESRTP